MGDGGASDLDRARAASQALDVQAKQLKLQQARGELVDRAAAEALVESLAAEERVAFQAFIRSAAAQCAAEFNISAADLSASLEAQLRAHMMQRAGAKVELAV